MIKSKPNQKEKEKKKEKKMKEEESRETMLCIREINVVTMK